MEEHQITENFLASRAFWNPGQMDLLLEGGISSILVISQKLVLTGMALLFNLIAIYGSISKLEPMGMDCWKTDSVDN